MDLSVWPFSAGDPLARSSATPFDSTAAGSVLIVLPLLGLAIYVWAFWSQPGGRQVLYRSAVMSCSGLQAGLVGIQNVHSSLLSLMLMDVINGVAAIVLGGALIQACPEPVVCVVSTSVWFVTRSVGVMSHLLVTLVYVLYLGATMQGAQLRCLFAIFSVFFSVLILLFVFLSQFGFILLAVCVFALFISVVVKYVKTDTPAASGNKAKLVVGVAAAIVLTVFVPSLVVESMMFSGALADAALFLDILFYSNFNVVLDGVLCYLILAVSAADGEGQQAPVAGWQPPTFGEQPPATGWQPPATGWQPPATAASSVTMATDAVQQLSSPA